MNRLEKFRYIRNIRRRNRLAVVLSFLLLFSGILVADSSMNRLMNRESGPGMVYMAPYGDTHYYIRFLNEDIYINVKYIKEDIKKLKNWLSGIF
ncbi:MAG TPA: hypothetical protein DEF39_12975 [Hungateiclostridium thermocellum]|uniref:Uncharacterized protein n=1 Tax=Acetivibrio thermocellus (strain ATCC 27405 / DSM 1237 / JCM 9322 / NBRC 103400 / NCIMB 10682 / NRRL B-4536 / VPI 7372) TaxID=203119 RepID=A3DF30_ACET2|nr:hypothetical protein [Acetivibrio thermocellus]ABN52559.1 hypothetical protein Cthe_1327 [Acetivibrio thermocellus ATCC 27405]HBW28148.1 hypothetical protein [Acetivibrio thermocellus]